MEHEINILVIEPGKPPRPARVDYSPETLSQIVGGELAMCSCSGSSTAWRRATGWPRARIWWQRQWARYPALEH